MTWIKSNAAEKLISFFSGLGCITAEELKFVLTHLPGKVTYKEIDEMIRTVDENGDGKINYQEFRVMIGAKPNLKAAREAQKAAEAKSTKTTTTGATTTTTLTTSTLSCTMGNSTTTTTPAVAQAGGGLGKK